MNEQWEEMRAEIARQDEAFAGVERMLAALGDAGMSVPQAFLEELDELTSPRRATPVAYAVGLRV